MYEYYDYSCSNHWVVKGYKNKEDADQHAIKAKQRAIELIKTRSKEVNEYDAKFVAEYVGQENIDYTVEETFLFDQLTAEASDKNAGQDNIKTPV